MGKSGPGSEIGGLEKPVRHELSVQNGQCKKTKEDGHKMDMNPSISRKM